MGAERRVTLLVHQYNTVDVQPAVHGLKVWQGKWFNLSILNPKRVREVVVP